MSSSCRLCVAGLVCAYFLCVRSRFLCVARVLQSLSLVSPTCCRVFHSCQPTSRLVLHVCCRVFPSCQPTSRLVSHVCCRVFHSCRLCVAESFLRVSLLVASCRTCVAESFTRVSRLVACFFLFVACVLQSLSLVSPTCCYLSSSVTNRNIEPTNTNTRATHVQHA